MRELTYREKQHIAMLALGMTSAEMSEALGKTKASVDNAVATIMWSMGVNNRPQAVAQAFQRGYLIWNDGSLLIK